MTFLVKPFSTALLALGLGAASAQAATYSISWTGGGGYTMTGLLTFADSLLGTGVIDETDITDLSITIWLNNVAVGARSLLADGAGSHAATFNVNFDTNLGQFVVGGYSASETGQDWFTSVGGSECDTVGFSSGSAGQLACTNGSFADAYDSYISIGESTLSATRVSEVPLPASLPLLGMAVGAVALARRRRRS